MSEGDKGIAQTKAQHKQRTAQTKLRHELGKEIDFPTKTTYSTNKAAARTKAQHNAVAQ